MDDVGVGEGVGLDTVTPLFQTSLVPDLIQVYFLPDTNEVEPSLMHFVPAFSTASDGCKNRDATNRRNKKILKLPHLIKVTGIQIF
jgi:hypothetical protein